MAPPTSNAPESPQNGGEWLSVGAAARRLELSERTIQRKAARGELLARTVSDGQGKRLLIRFEPKAPNDIAADKLPTCADNLTTPSHAQNGEAADISGVAADKVPTPNDIAADTSFAGHLLEENRFLRGLVESHARAEAELRTTLREALRAMPKQLAAPSPSVPDASLEAKLQQVETQKKEDLAPVGRVGTASSAKVVSQRARNEVRSSGPDPLEGAQTGANGGESLTLSDVADLLEAMEREMNR